MFPLMPSPVACSGAMYAGVPTTWVSPLACSIAFATPRSAISSLSRSESVERSRRFCGLMSRWITPCRWSTDSPAAAWSTRSMASGSGSGRSPSSIEASDPRSAYVITKYGVPSASPMS